jgi:hypothetical protein
MTPARGHRGGPALGATVLVAFLTALCLAPQASGAYFTCGAHPGARVIARDHAGLVLAVRVTPRRANPYDVFDACTAAARPRITRLGDDRDCTAKGVVGDFRLVGRFVALRYSFCGMAEGHSRVWVVDVRSGRRTLDVADTALLSASDSIAGLVANADGAVAWIDSTTAPSPPDATTVEVRRVDSHGRETLLDSGGAIALRSLRATPSRISWSDGATTKTAPWS